jgi:hypothetical protein
MLSNLKISDTDYDINVDVVEKDKIYTINSVNVESGILYQFYLFIFDKVPILYNFKSKKIYNYNDDNINYFIIPIIYILYPNYFEYKNPVPMEEITEKCEEGGCSIIQFLNDVLENYNFQLTPEYEDEKNQVLNYFNNIYN